MKSLRPAPRIRLAAAVCLSAAALCALAWILPAAGTPAAFAQTSPTPFASVITQIALPTNHLAYNPATQTIFASLPSRAGARGNSVVQIDPVARTFGTPVFVGSEPQRMAFSDDGQTMYVALRGAEAVRRFDVATNTPGLEFSIARPNFSGMHTAEYLAVMPGQPQTVAVARNGPSSFAGTAIYDNGVPRPEEWDRGNTAVHFNAAGTRLYGGTTSIRRLTVSASGLDEDLGSVTSAGGESQFDRARGLLFNSFGDVINPEGLVWLRQLPGTGLMALDAAGGRVYFMGPEPQAGPGVYKITAYDINTFNPVGYTYVTGVQGPPSDLVRWGTNGLAFRTTVPCCAGGFDQVVLVQTQLVDPAPLPPAPNPTPAPLPTPEPATLVRRVNLRANDIVYNAATNTLHASVPSAAGAGGNSVTPIDPTTLAVGAPVAVGSEPNRLALSDDGRTLYTHLDGENAVRRVDLQTQTAGLKFAPGPQQPPADMEVQPGRPQSLAVSFGVNRDLSVVIPRGVAIYDDGVARPKTGDNLSFRPVGPFEFASPTVIYGYADPTSDSALARFDVDETGATATSVTPYIVNTFSGDIEYADGRVYFSAGYVVDPEAKRVVGTFDTRGVMTVDAQLGRAFFIGSSGSPETNETHFLTAYDLDTFLPIGRATFQMKGGEPTRVVRWGANGLAVRMSDSNSNTRDGAVYVIQSALVSPSVPVPAAVQLFEDDPSAAESAGELAVVVTRTGDLSQTTTVTYATADGTAKAGSDYEAASGTLTFAPGESSKSILIAVTPDDIFEGDETFAVTLGTPSGGALLTGSATAVATIRDDDGQPTIDIADARVAEGHAGTRDAEFLVTLSNPSTQTVTFNYVTGDGTAATPADYEGTSGLVTLPPLATSAVIRVKVVGDAQVEPDETFTVSLSTPTNATFSRSAATGIIVNDEGPTVFRFARALYAVGEAAGQTSVTVTRSGDLSAPSSVSYATSDGTASEVSDYTLTLGTLDFAAGEVEKSVTLLISNDEFAEQQEEFNVTLNSPTGGALDTPSAATVTIVEDDLSPGLNPVVPPGFNPDIFVTQHYHDFLNREPDAEGLAHWTGEFAQCKGDEGCLEAKRVNVSAAFFLSIEFQETGYFVYRVHQAAYDTRHTLRLRTFIADTQEIGRGVRVGVGDWRAQLDANKKAFVDQFVTSPAFAAAYGGLTNAQYVDALNAKTFDPRAPGSGGALSAAERDALVADLDASRKTRADVLRAVAENAEFSRRQFNNAFVLMEYFGYLRRNPDDAPDGNFDGYNFWLGKLNEFGGDYIAAEMVKAFITSNEYRQRFGP
jgi:hypothetical protein